LNHYEENIEHNLAISYPECSIWCYSCDSYIMYESLDIENKSLLTNEINKWIENKEMILNKYMSMETNTKSFDIKMVNRKLKIVSILRG